MEQNNVVNQGQNDSTKQIAGAIIIAGLIIAGAVLLKDNTQPVANNNNNPTNDPNDRTATMSVKAVSVDEHIVGNLDAPVVIIEYSDTECPFCKSFHNTMQGVVAQNSGKVAWVFRHYPLSIHPKAFHEAEATECAWGQGGNDTFWKYVDEVFKRTESNNKLEVSELPKIAKDIGLDVPTFNACLDGGKYKAKVQASIDEKNKTGQIGTPFNVVMTKKDITTKMQEDIKNAINSPGAVSFSSKDKKVMSMNGALPLDMINKIMGVLLK
ncbi:MAG: thioredoxin domain-containing protein [Candidatus Paceibacterota bacterium]